MARPSKGKLSKQIFLGYSPDGKRIQKRIYADSPRGLLRAEIEFRKSSAPVSGTFGVYAKKWFATYNKTKSKATTDAYERIIDNNFNLINHYPLSDITRTDIQNIINDNSDKPQLCRKIKTVLVQIFKCAMSDGYIDRNPADGITLPRTKEVSRRALTEAEKKSISEVELIDSDRIYLLCLLYFGLRPSEAAALEASDFDLEQETVTISKALEFTNSNAPRIKGTKTNTIRKLPIPSAFIPDLKSYLENLQGFLFVTKDGEMLSKTAMRRKFDRIKRSLDCGDDLHPYIFRYNYATQLYYSGITIKKAAELMGHSNTAMILKIYAQIDSEREKIDALKKMDFLNNSSVIQQKP